MKSATIPPLRVTPSLRQEVESVLKEGETLSGFVEESLRRHVEQRKFQQNFMARALSARERAEVTGNYVSKDQLMSSLEAIRDASKKEQ